MATVRMLVWGLAAALSGCGSDDPPAVPAAPPRTAPAAPSAPPSAPSTGSTDDSPPPAVEVAPGTAPVTMALPAGLFKDAEVWCASGERLPGVPEDAGQQAVLMVHGLPEGQSCVVFLRGEVTTRVSPVTAGQRWRCKFRRAEPRCKLLGGPAAPTIASPEDWAWDKPDADGASAPAGGAPEAGAAPAGARPVAPGE